MGTVSSVLPIYLFSSPIGDKWRSAGRRRPYEEQRIENALKVERQEKGTGVFFGAGLSPSIPVRSKRPDLGFPGGVRLVLGTLGGTAGPNEPRSQASSLKPQASSLKPQALPRCVPTLIVGRSGLSLV